MESNNFNAILTTKQSSRYSKFAEYAHLGLTLKFFKGESVAKSCRDDDDLYLYYVVSGGVRFCYQRGDESQVELYYREKGNIFQTEYKQFASICNDNLKVIAKENTIVSAFTKQQLYELVQQDRDLFEELLLVTHLTFGTLGHRIINTAYLSSGERILTWLTKLCTVNELDKQGYYKLPCELTQQQIADLLFIHVTTCNKLFTFLERSQLVKKTKKYIFVYDYQKLLNYLEDEIFFVNEVKKFEKHKEESS